MTAGLFSLLLRDVILPFFMVKSGINIGASILIDGSASSNDPPIGTIHSDVKKLLLSSTRMVTFFHLFLTSGDSSTFISLLEYRLDGADITFCEFSGSFLLQPAPIRQQQSKIEVADLIVIGFICIFRFTCF